MENDGLVDKTNVDWQNISIMNAVSYLIWQLEEHYQAVFMVLVMFFVFFVILDAKEKSSRIEKTEEDWKIEEPTDMADTVKSANSLKSD